MSSETTQRERVRVYATGSCEGFDKLRDSLAKQEYQVTVEPELARRARRAIERMVAMS